MGLMQLNVLSEAEIATLHQKTLEVFEQVGIKIADDQILKKLAKAGAKIDQTSQIAKFPPQLVQELLAQAPSTLTAAGVKGQTWQIGGKHRFYTSIVTDPWINDYHDGIRPPKLQDIRRHTIISDSLDRIGAAQRMQAPVSDVPAPDCYYKTMEVFLCNFSKHILALPASEENCHEWLDICEIMADAAGLDKAGPPLLSIGMAVTSPLQIHPNNIQITRMGVERGCPITPIVCPMAGTTSPYSLAGTALQGSVESLSAALVVQLLKPGHPVYYSFAPSVTDMKSGHDLYYKAEKMIWKTICCQMGKFYNLPVSHESGGSLTHLPDMQNGAESMSYILTSMCGGQNKFGGLGSLGNANGMSAEQIIMQCGLVDMAEYLARGVDLSDHKLGFDSIMGAGPGGNYLTDQLTMDLLRSDEFFESPYFDLTGGYVQAAPGMYEIAHQKVEELVADYKPTVPEKVRTAIKEFFKDRYQDKSLTDL